MFGAFHDPPHVGIYTQSEDLSPMAANAAARAP